MLALGLLLAGCSSQGGERPGPHAAPTSSASTLTPLPPPSPSPPSGEVHAELRQSSRDVALGRMQVWLSNDTARDLTPARLLYRDDRFRAPLTGERLRAVPAGNQRGFPLALPRRPQCGQSASRARIVVEHSGAEQVLPVADPTEVAGRFWAARCLELRVQEVARLRWADQVTVEGTGQDAVGRLVLEVEPTGTGAGRLRILTVGGTPLLGPVGDSHWNVAATVTVSDADLRIPLPVRPVRCDGHAFMEAAGATTFRVTVELDGERGSLLLRMSDAGAASALTLARTACGLD